MVIRAAGAAARQAPVGLLLVGDGSARRKLELLADRFATIAVMPHLADRGELARLLASADALVHGCEAETFCMVAAEARASGIPLIVPDRGAAVEQCVAGAGATFRSANEAALQRAIIDFIDRGPELQRAAAVRASQVRTMDEHFAELFARYETLSRPLHPILPIERELRRARVATRPEAPRSRLRRLGTLERPAQRLGDHPLERIAGRESRIRPSFLSIAFKVFATIGPSGRPRAIKSPPPIGSRGGFHPAMSAASLARPASNRRSTAHSVPRSYASARAELPSSAIALHARRFFALFENLQARGDVGRDVRIARQQATPGAAAHRARPAPPAPPRSERRGSATRSMCDFREDGLQDCRARA